mgnify:FL=1
MGEVPKKRIIIVIVIILALVLLVPTPIAYYDGGTVEYRAILYRVIDYHKLKANGYDTGIGVKVLGTMIYENKTFIEDPNMTFIESLPIEYPETNNP